MQQDSKTALLYTPGRNRQGILHRCEVGDIKRGRPDTAYPKYYERDIFNAENEPDVYFKMLSIESIDMSFLEDYVVAASGKPVIYDLKKSISSYMYIQHKDAPRKEKTTKKQVKKKAAPELKVDMKSCAYKKDGKCGNRSCVNYLYDCERPSNCLKQKPVKYRAE